MLIDMQTLKDKNILVIGATGGIGSRAAKLLAGSGAKLFLTGRKKQSLQEVASACNVPLDRCFVLDCSQGVSVIELKERYFQQLATIDILINAAGLGIIKSMSILDETDFLLSLNANLVAPFLLMKAFLPAMKQANTGLIINIPGVWGKVPMAGAAAYCASNIDLKVQHEKLEQVEEAAKAIWFLCQQPNSGVVSEMVLQPFNHQVI